MRLLSYILTIPLLALTANLSGQDYKNVRDFEYIRSATPWLSSNNAAGLGTLPVSRIANVEAVFHKHNGALTSIEKSSDSFEAGASTEAFMNLSERFSLHGRLEYMNFNGKNMVGPVMMNPSYNPLNFYESTDKTAGSRNRETYNLAGGFSYSITKDLAVGASIDYTAADMAKKKDPRFVNKWMDLDLNAGLSYRVSDGLTLGASLIYKRTLEDLTGNVYGNTDKQYDIFVDYGGFYGVLQMFDGESGYLAQNNLRPMINNFYGGSLQIEAGTDTKVFNEITYLKRVGYYGKKASSSITYTEHSSDFIEYSGVLTTGNSSCLHRVGLDMAVEALRGLKNSYRTHTDEGSESIIEYFTPKETLAQLAFEGRLSYDGYLGIDNYRPMLEYGISVDGYMKIAHTVIFPYMRRSEIKQMSLKAYVLKNLFIKDKNMLTIGLDGIFGVGAGNPNSDKILVKSTSEAPASLDVFMNRDFEYRTAPQAGGGLRFRYTRFVGPRMGLYIEAKDCFMSMLRSPEYLDGRFRNVLETKIGITF